MKVTINRSELFNKREKLIWDTILMTHTIAWPKPKPGSEDWKEIQRIRKLLDDEKCEEWIIERDNQRLTISSQNEVCYELSSDEVADIEMLSLIFELLGKR
jgi:hypothetical protein